MVSQYLCENNIQNTLNLVGSTNNFYYLTKMLIFNCEQRSVCITNMQTCRPVLKGLVHYMSNYNLKVSLERLMMRETTSTILGNSFENKNNEFLF